MLLATILQSHLSTPHNTATTARRKFRVKSGIMEGGEKKRDLLDKIAETERKIENHEREISSLIYERRHEFRAVFCALEETDAKLVAQRKRDKQELRRQVDKVRLSVEAFKRLLSEMKPGPVCVEKLKITMEEIESSITAFKEKQREAYEELLQEERVVVLEVNALEKKLDNWSSLHPASTQPSVSHPRQTTQASSLHPAVLAFDAFVERTGGHRGGWDDYDHQTFLRIRTRHGDKPGFIQAAVSELPTRNVSEIEEHEKWYQEYSKQSEAKKTAINEWRQQKKDSYGLSQKEPALDIEETKPHKAELLAKEREERLAQLAAWKAQQQLKQEEEEKLKQEQEMERLREIEKARERQAAVKEKALEYAAKKVQEKQALKLLEESRQNEERARKKEATKEVKKFRERDTKASSEKRLKQKLLELEAMEKERRLQKLKEEVKITAERDPTRLLKLTAGWEERKKAGTGSGMAGAVLAMPRRAVPSWRQGI